MSKNKGKLHPKGRTAGTFSLTPFDDDDFADIEDVFNPPEQREETKGKKYPISPEQREAIQRAGQQYIIRLDISRSRVLRRDIKETIKHLKHHAEPLIDLLQNLDNTTAEKLISAAPTEHRAPLTGLLIDGIGIAPVEALVAAIEAYQSQPAPTFGRPKDRGPLMQLCNDLRPVFHNVFGEVPTCTPEHTDYTKPASKFIRFCQEIAFILSPDARITDSVIADQVRKLPIM